MKFPVGGRQLLTQREQGIHPRRVWVICSADRARKPRNAPCLFIGPDDDPVKFDWSVLTGVAAHIVARGGWCDQVLSLITSIAVHAEPVLVHARADADDWPWVEGKPYHAEASDVVFGARNAGCWPLGWSDALDADYARRKWEYWQRCYLAVIGEGGEDEQLRPGSRSGGP